MLITMGMLFGAADSCGMELLKQLTPIIYDLSRIESKLPDISELPNSPNLDEYSYYRKLSSGEQSISVFGATYRGEYYPYTVGTKLDEISFYSAQLENVIDASNSLVEYIKYRSNKLSKKICVVQFCNDMGEAIDQYEADVASDDVGYEKLKKCLFKKPIITNISSFSQNAVGFSGPALRLSRRRCDETPEVLAFIKVKFPESITQTMRRFWAPEKSEAIKSHNLSEYFVLPKK